MCLQLRMPRLVHKLFAGGKVMQLVISNFQLFVVFVVVVEFCACIAWPKATVFAFGGKEILPIA